MMEKAHPIFSTAILGAIFTILTIASTLFFAGYSHDDFLFFKALLCILIDISRWFTNSNDGASTLGKLLASGFAFNIIGTTLQQISIWTFQNRHSRTGPKWIIKNLLIKPWSQATSSKDRWFEKADSFCPCKSLLNSNHIFDLNVKRLLDGNYKSIKNVIDNPSDEALWTWLHWSDAPGELLEAGRRRRKWRYLGENWIVAIVLSVLFGYFISKLLFNYDIIPINTANCADLPIVFFKNVHAVMSWLTFVFIFLMLFISIRIMKFNKVFEETFVSAYLIEKIHPEFTDNFPGRKKQGRKLC